MFLIISVNLALSAWGLAAIIASPVPPASAKSWKAAIPVALIPVPYAIGIVLTGLSVLLANSLIVLKAVLSPEVNSPSPITIK